ncbi:MAG: elongation factor P hydroxylase [Legionella sp.]
MHDYNDLIRIFNHCFLSTYNTRLIKGVDEPIYRPASDKQPFNAIYFAHGFFSSALHECAHWFIAGEQRRKLIDYGYWYIPDGRNAQEQALFQQVEVKPQALECLLSTAAGYKFQLSVDNLDGEPGDIVSFKQAIREQIKHYQQQLPRRAAIFYHALHDFYAPLVKIDLEQQLLSLSVDGC